MPPEIDPPVYPRVGFRAFGDTSYVDESDERLLTGHEAAAELASDPEQRRKFAAYAWQKFGLPREEADEVIQETCVDLLHLRQLVRSREGLAFRIFTLRCSKDLKARRRRPEATGFESVLARQESRDLPADDRVLLREAFEGMSPICRRLVMALYLEGISPLEMARTGKWASPKVVSNMTSRCIRKLRDRLSGARG